jgi:TIR domain
MGAKTWMLHVQFFELGNSSDAGVW